VPITDDFKRLPIGSIVVERDSRQRREFETKDLERSIQNIGLLNPIIVDRNLVLKAGERRLSACKALGHQDIAVRFIEQLSPVEAQIIELEENLNRVDLEWQDQVSAVARIHNLYRELDQDWTQADTGEHISLSQGTIAMYLRVNAEMLMDRVAKASTVREAWGIIQRKDSREHGEALAELLDDTDAALAAPAADGDLPFPTEGQGSWPASSHTIGADGKHTYTPPRAVAPVDPIKVESFLEWGPAYKGRKFNLLHCDFPYGIGFADGPQGRGLEPGEIYDDSPEVYWTLLDCLCLNLDKIMSVSAHLMFWLSAEHSIQVRTRETFARLAPTLEFQKFPLIWVKSDNAGIASDSRRNPRHIYETCLLASRGRRQIVKIVSDAYSAPTDKRLHISTKPEPMLRHFMGMLVDENTSLFDPTAGSGAALRAADELGAKTVLGLEIDQKSAEVANQAFRNARSLRRASKILEA
jgi:ParB-like chromosome segregation protein Spo0J